MITLQDNPVAQVLGRAKHGRARWVREGGHS